ncbi:MAG TPA: type IV pilus twitching motility protein PilT [Tissierellaceae bacterium]|nr:type IV pilus twitching motility protein PilT [Tissierellaceae bacterium]
MKMKDLTNIAYNKKASDIHISVNAPILFRIDGSLIPLNNKILNEEDTKQLVEEILSIELIKELETKGELDFSYSNSNTGRYRVNIFKQKGTFSIVLRLIPFEIPSMQSLGLPKISKDLAMLKQGLILVTGPTGSGKTTTLASMINFINQEKSCHILTLEDPIEYIHNHNKSLINQREIGKDTESFSGSIRSALRQDPDIILIGELRDLETISIALTAAETGHLVLSTLHTSGSYQTINRIIDIFPYHQQQQIRTQLSEVLKGIISQVLIPKASTSGRVAAFETMIVTRAIKNLIREDKIHQISGIIETGSRYGMQTLDNSLLNLCRDGIINKKDIHFNSINNQ